MPVVFLQVLLYLMSRRLLEPANIAFGCDKFKKNVYFAPSFKWGNSVKKGHEKKTVLKKFCWCRSCCRNIYEFGQV